MQLSASPSGDAGIPVTDKAWQKIEARFRLWSFHIYYDRSYATEIDPTLRFVGNLVETPDGAINEIDPVTIQIGDPVRAVFHRVEDLVLNRWVRA